MPEYFDGGGHITDEGFETLANGEPDLLDRLELGEHLSFCNSCVDRYAETLENLKTRLLEAGVAGPVMSSVTKMRLRLYRKYLTAAAAAVIAMTLWVAGFSKFDFSVARYNVYGASEDQNASRGWLDSAVSVTRDISRLTGNLTSDLAKKLSINPYDWQNGKDGSADAKK